MFEMENAHMHDPRGNAKLEEQQSALYLEGFAPQEFARLRRARDRFLRGDLNEWTGNYKRLLFARWLYEHGCLVE